MADKIIQTLKTKARNPGISFALSLIFPGMGQMYNGDLFMGAAFCLLRTMPFLVLPAWIMTRRPATTIIAFFCFIAIVLVMTIAPPLEALICARRNREMPLKAYNSSFSYVLFGLVQSILTAVGVLIILTFFTIEQVKDKNAGPLLKPDEVVLINRYMPGGARRGDLVIMADGTVGRVTAIGGDTVIYDDNVFFVNGRILSLGYLADEVIARFSAEREDILSESNEGRKYPVRFKQSPSIAPEEIPRPIRKGTVLIAADTRLEQGFARVVHVDAIQGRVEGILFSSQFLKIGMDSYAGLK
jgi:hypothetical protein